MRRHRAAWGGIVGPAAFITAWSTLGARADGYAPVEDAISRLAASGAATRWPMTLGFVAFGTALPVYATALRSAVDGPAWLAAAVTGVATLGVAACPLSADGGQPVDVAHAAFAVAGYATLAAAPLLAARPLRRAGRQRAARWSTVVGVLSGACLAASTVGPATGLFQRAGLTIADAWVVASAVTLLRRAP